MRHFPIVGLLLAALCASPAVRAQDATVANATHEIQDGQLAANEAFANRREWIREFLFVETPFDTDGDGKQDRMHVDVTRPSQTKSQGLKVPVIYETSPYFAGNGPMDTSYYWDVKHDLGEQPKQRATMAPIGFGKKPGMIANNDPLTARWLPRGLAVVHSCSPGTGWSQGCPTIGGDNEAQAPKAVIDWLCGRAKGFTTRDGNEEIKADWCTGKVAMIGTSYNGTLPVAAATTGVEGLVAIIPVAPATSWYRYYRSNGLVRSPGGYLGEDVDVLFDFIASGDPKKRDWCIEHVRDADLAKNADRITGDYSDWWAARDYLEKLSDYKAATLVAHGFNDWNVMPEQTVLFYAALKQKGVPCMAYFHQSAHGGDPPFAMVNRWFTRFLFDVDNGIETDPKAWIVRESDKNGSPTAYADYPNPEAAPVTLHLGKGGNATGALLLVKQSGQGSETLVDDVELAGGALASEEKSEHRLLFALPAFTAPVHVSGTARITIKLACDQPATNLSVWLVSLPWTDSRRITDDLITRGWADPQNAKSIRAGEPLIKGKSYELSFDLNPDDQVIATGEQLGLMIFASDREFTLWPKPGAKVTIDLDATTLTLPVVGGVESLKAALAASTAK
jgi:X-Pro dipeptidyl-peptidase